MRSPSEGACLPQTETATFTRLKAEDRFHHRGTARALPATQRRSVGVPPATGGRPRPAGGSGIQFQDRNLITDTPRGRDATPDAGQGGRPTPHPRIPTWKEN